MTKPEPLNAAAKMFDLEYENVMLKAALHNALFDKQLMEQRVAAVHAQLRAMGRGE